MCVHVPLQSYRKHVRASVLWYWWVIIFWWMWGTQEGCTGGVSMSHVSCIHIHTKVFISVPHACTQADFQRHLHLHSVSPSQIKTNGFILFSRRLLFGLLLYEPEMYIVSEASVGRATGGVCQSEAQSSNLDWWLAPGLEAPSGDRSNKFITKQQSVY